MGVVSAILAERVSRESAASFLRAKYESAADGCCAVRAGTPAQLVSDGGHLCGRADRHEGLSAAPESLLPRPGTRPARISALFRGSRHHQPASLRGSEVVYF